MKLNEKLLRTAVLITILIPLGFGHIATPAALGQTATLRGQITDEDTGTPLPNVAVTLGERIIYTDNDGNYEFIGITPSDSCLFTATTNNYEDHGERITISEGSNLKNVSLVSTGSYNGDADNEFTLSINDPETGNAHIVGKYRNIFTDTVRLRISYIEPRWNSIENIVVTDENGDPLPFDFYETDDFFHWFKLDIYGK